MKEDVKRKWTSPEVRRYGTFEATTKSCNNKDFGSSDGLVFQGADITFACGS
jgi:hypothetical protein